MPIQAIRLAERLNGLFTGTDLITVEQVKRDRQRFHELPRRGDVREEKLASPTKYVIRNKADQLVVTEALAEIIDNVFDNYERQPASTRNRQLSIDVTVYHPLDDGVSERGELIVRETSGGIPYERVVPLIQLGYSDRASGSIGAWGEGFKMAVFALGQEVEVFSHYPNEPPVCIYFPKGWLDPSDSVRWKEWKVNTHAVSRNPPAAGTTIIRVSNLHNKVSNFFGIAANSDDDDAIQEACKNLASYFGEVYAEKARDLQDAGFSVAMTLRIGETQAKVVFADRIESRLQRSFAFIPWLRPIRWERHFEVPIDDENRSAKLDVTIYAGLSANETYSPIYARELSRPGVEMWGNGRLFSLKGRITDESVGWGYVFGGSGGRNPTSNSSTRRITIIAVFTAEDSRDIPWAAPVKNDYNRRSEFYAEI